MARMSFVTMSLPRGVVVVAAAALVYGVIEGRPAKPAPEVTPVKVVEPPALLPAPRTEPKAEAAALAAPASIVPAPEPRPTSTRVTHTALPNAGEAPPSAVVPRAAPDATRKPEPACGEAVTAHGLCR